MKRLFKCIIMSFMLLSFSSVLSGQQRLWDLTACIDYAIEHNNSIKMQQLTIDVEALDLKQSKAVMLPTLTANATHGYNWGQTVDMYTNEFASSRVQTNNFYVQSGYTVFNGFALLNTVKQHQYNLMSKRLEADKAKNDIMLNVATAYLQVLFSYEQYAIASQQRDLSIQQVDRTRQLVSAGALAKGELLAVEAQLANEELAVINAENSLDIAYLTLAQLMNLSEDIDFTIVKPIIELPIDSDALTLDATSIFNVALDKQPEVAAAYVGVESAQTGLKISRGKALPSLHLSASIGTGYSGARKEFYDYTITGYQPTMLVTGTGEIVYEPVLEYNEKIKPFGSQIDDNFNQSVALYLSVPLFNGLQNHSNIQRTKIAMEQAALDLEITKQQLQKEIQQAYADARAALKRYEATQGSVEALQESFEYANEKFDVGMITSFEYNDAKNKLAAAEADLISAKYEFVFKVKVLDFYLGNPMKL